VSKANGTNKQRRFWLPTSEKFGSEGSTPSLIHFIYYCAYVLVLRHNFKYKMSKNYGKI